MLDRKTYEKEYMGKIVSDEEVISYLQNENRNLKKENEECHKKIMDLHIQIEKMKCCGNCKHCVFKYDDEDLIFECDLNGMESYTHLKTCINWELANDSSRTS